MTLPSASTARPTQVRNVLLAVATANAFLLYLDRLCMSAVVQSASFQSELGLSKSHVGDVLAAFFFAYALGQPAAGWLADRFGPRRMLAAYIVLWSAFTAMTGFAVGLATLLATRLACGIAEAGAYPASARLISRWFPFVQRGRANSFVAFGGRLGGALAIGLTAWLIAHLGAWRPVLWIYGGIGLFLAAATWFCFRDSPADHPWANEAERELIQEGPPAAPAVAQPFPWRELLSHPGLWCLSAAGVGLNLGWAFLVTWLPSYLREVRGVEEVVAGRYATIALLFGMGGVLFGGLWCDALTRWYGPAWGRRLPLIIGSVVGVVAYLLCPHVPSALWVVALCAVVTFAADSMVTAVWSLAQDLGHAHVGATLAWSNMWGNLGAALVAKLIPVVHGKVNSTDWSEIFWLCALGFAICGGMAFLVDSRRGLGKAALR